LPLSPFFRPSSPYRVEARIANILVIGNAKSVNVEKLVDENPLQRLEKSAFYREFDAQAEK
jgi:hypothetical protein